MEPEIVGLPTFRSWPSLYPSLPLLFKREGITRMQATMSQRNESAGKEMDLLLLSDAYIARTYQPLVNKSESTVSLV